MTDNWRFALDIAVYCTHTGPDPGDNSEVRCNVIWEGPTTRVAWHDGITSDEIRRGVVYEYRKTSDTYNLPTDTNLRQQPYNTDNDLITYGSNLREQSPFGGSQKIYGDWVDIGENQQYPGTLTVTILEDDKEYGTIVKSFDAKGADPTNYKDIWHTIEGGEINGYSEALAYKLRLVPPIPAASGGFPP